MDEFNLTSPHQHKRGIFHFERQKPHPDVINPQPRVIIFGYGWVGNFIHKFFTEADIFSSEFGLYIQEQDKTFSEEQISGFVKENGWDLGIICVPIPQLESGKCDISIVEEVISRWHEHVNVFMIKSTVEIGTTNYIKEKYNVRVVFSPEYIGESLNHPLAKPDPSMFLILGGSQDDTALVARYWKRVLHPDAIIRQVPAKTAELCKYMENAFFATKVTFFNEFYDLAEACNINYEELREIFLLDPRINRSHTFVYEENRGFSGKCLPKDLKALIFSAREKGCPVHLIEFIIERNSYFRSLSKKSV